MIEPIFSFLKSEYFWIIVVVWLMISLAWVEKRVAMRERIKALLAKPIIFQSDPNPDNVPFYPRRLLEATGNSIRENLSKPFRYFVDMLSSLATRTSTLVYNREHPFRTFGNLLFLAFFLFFLLSDAIAIANSLTAFNLLADPLPDLLTRFDIAVFGGSFLSLIIGTMIVFEIQSAKSELTQLSEKEPRIKSIFLLMALLVAFFSLVFLVFWALLRLITLGALSSNLQLDTTLNWILYGLLPINTALAATLCLDEAMRGFLVLSALLIWIIILVFNIFNYVITILAAILPYTFDIAYRLIYITVDLLLWFVLTPIELMVRPISKLIK